MSNGGLFYVTLHKAPDCPAFCQIQWEELRPDGVVTVAETIGTLIRSAIHYLPSIINHIEIIHYVILPDCVHILIRVGYDSELRIDQILDTLASKITHFLRRQLDDEEFEVFATEYELLEPERQRHPDAICAYMERAAYRRAVMQEQPAYTDRLRTISFMGRELQAYGNPFLLRNPFKYALVVHRADSDTDFTRKLAECLRIAKNGGVIVSAFVSPREKEIRMQLERADAQMIIMHHLAYGHGVRPSDDEIARCRKGEMLMLSPLDYRRLPISVYPSRQQCLDMNHLAEAIAAV